MTTIKLWISEISSRPSAWTSGMRRKLSRRRKKFKVKARNFHQKFHHGKVFFISILFQNKKKQLSIQIPQPSCSHSLCFHLILPVLHPFHALSIQLFGIYAFSLPLNMEFFHIISVCENHKIPIRLLIPSISFARYDEENMHEKNFLYSIFLPLLAAMKKERRRRKTHRRLWEKLPERYTRWLYDCRALMLLKPPIDDAQFTSNASVMRKFTRFIMNFSVQ